MCKLPHLDLTICIHKGYLKPIFQDSDSFSTLSSLAMIELKVFIASTLLGHTIELPPNSDPNDMTPLYGAVIRPKAEKCELIFRPIAS